MCGLLKFFFFPQAMAPNFLPAIQSSWHPMIIQAQQAEVLEGMIIIMIPMDGSGAQAVAPRAGWCVVTAGDFNHEREDFKFPRVQVAKRARLTPH